MRKVHLVAAVVSAALVFTVAPALAHDNTYVSKATSLIAHCGSDWYESAVFAGGYIKETGVSGTRQFRVTFVLQVWDATEQKWFNGSTSVSTSTVFPDDASNYSWRPRSGAGNEAQQVDATPAHQDRSIRARVVFEWLGVNADGSTTLLHRHVSSGIQSCLIVNLPPPPPPPPPPPG